ncbi:MAG: hypothetical protein HUJ67_04170 [Ruminiclostridium sp.]|nr:hypothetical protein [Ruminiclostridium sp.]
MSSSIDIHYGVIFGKLDASDWIDWYSYTFIDDEEKAAYERAKLLRLPLNEVPALRHILEEAYSEIEEEEIEKLLDEEDEYVMECTGVLPMDADELNDLVDERDPHALAFFGLTDLSEEELDEWDADDLDELPLNGDFVEDFEPYSPFDEGYGLNVQFVECPDEENLTEEEARGTLGILFGEAKGDYSVVQGYVRRCSCLYPRDESLPALAEQVAAELGITDYPGIEK